MATIEGSENIREREKIVKEIAKTSNSIRKKLRAMKTGKIEKDIELNTQFKPLVEPLKKIADNSSLIAVKKEEPESVVDVEIETSPVQQRGEEEGDATPKRKRKRTSSWSGRLKPTPLKFLKPKRPKVTPQDVSALITSTPLKTRTVQPMVPDSLASDDVFESMDASNLETSVREHLQTAEGRQTLEETLQNHLGPLSQKYIGDVLSGDRKSIDNVYGVYFGNDGMMLGNKRFDVDNADNVIIDGVRYAGTPGLYELIFKRMPDEDIYTEDDKQKYRSILLATNAHKRSHNANAPLLSNRGYKYKYVIARLLPVESKKKKSGKGLSMPRAMTLTDNNIDYVHWDDPNELVDRLRLLDASYRAGNDAHDNEITSIIEELREAGLIIN